MAALRFDSVAYALMRAAEMGIPEAYDGQITQRIIEAFDVFPGRDAGYDISECHAVRVMRKQWVIERVLAHCLAEYRAGRLARSILLVPKTPPDVGERGYQVQPAAR
jgi:hypothetical protein